MIGLHFRTSAKTAFDIPFAVAISRCTPLRAAGANPFAARRTDNAPFAATTVPLPVPQRLHLRAEPCFSTSQAPQLQSTHFHLLLRLPPTQCFLRSRPHERFSIITDLTRCQPLRSSFPHDMRMPHRLWRTCRAAGFISDTDTDRSPNSGFLRTVVSAGCYNRGT